MANSQTRSLYKKLFEEADKASKAKNFKLELEALIEVQKCVSNIFGVYETKALEVKE